MPRIGPDETTAVESGAPTSFVTTSHQKKKPVFCSYVRRITCANGQLRSERIRNPIYAIFRFTRPLDGNAIPQ